MGFNELFTKNLLVKHRVDSVNCRRLIVKHGVVLGQDTSSLKPGFLLEGEHADMISSACPSNVQWDKERKIFFQTNDEISCPLPCTIMELKWFRDSVDNQNEDSDFHHHGDANVLILKLLVCHV